MPEAVQVAGAWPEFHRLGWLGRPKALLQAARCACAGLPGLGSQKPGRRQVSGVVGSQEWALVLTRHLPNSKLLPTQTDILILEAELRNLDRLAQGVLREGPPAAFTAARAQHTSREPVGPGVDSLQQPPV